MCIGPKLGLWKFTSGLSSKGIVRDALWLWWLCQSGTPGPPFLSHWERTRTWSQHQENRAERSSPGDTFGACEEQSCHSTATAVFLVSSAKCVCLSFLRLPSPLSSLPLPSSPLLSFLFFLKHVWLWFLSFAIKSWKQWFLEQIAQSMPSNRCLGEWRLSWSLLQSCLETPDSLSRCSVFSSYTEAKRSGDSKKVIHLKEREPYNSLSYNKVVTFKYSQFSVFIGSTSVDLTNHRLKRFREKHYIDADMDYVVSLWWCAYTEMYRLLLFLSLFPKQYSITTIYIGFTLY